MTMVGSESPSPIHRRADLQHEIDQLREERARLQARIVELERQKDQIIIPPAKRRKPS